MARTWLQQTWPKESATVKTELLTVLEPPHETDMEWLESLLTEKSKQVKETVIRLLKNREFANSLGAAARERAVSEFSVEKLVIKNEEFYRQCLEGKHDE